MRLFKYSIALLCLSFLTGCAVGNQYDYQQADVSLPIKGTDKVSLGVIDNRSYVINGDKSANFIGLQRGGFGNPFEVTTSSGKPLTEDMSDVLERSLVQSGFQVNKLYFSSPDTSMVANVIKNNGQQKNIILTVSEWKTDVMMNIALIYDLELQVKDQEGREIASASARSTGKEKISGAGFQGQNSRVAVSAFETKVSRLFNNPAIVKALKD
ncbi:hypothetical protein EH243_09810 [Amphritea opalescens]|uniref:Lipoprotein n=1 Tax=Amphritea opalescens TaxID=2490544 RepID=A0A430KR70_9GAMM|nr:hypothetical protein [Amphritea opalescens]RTE65968.1 hypothetical protein EH243_09810 [Amphritea opalescens]